MDRRLFLSVLVLALLAAPLAAQAQPVGKVYRIGYLLDAAPPQASFLLEESLRELGTLAKA